VIVGMEAHVCVLQSALGLQQAGYEAVVVADAISSRAPANRDAALQRLRENGVEVATTEMVLFEWLGQAGTPEFKELSKLIR
jgi:nicotinamidase-related amidase